MRPRDPSWSRAILKGSGAPKYGRTTAAHAAAEAAEAEAEAARYAIVAEVAASQPYLNPDPNPNPNLALAPALALEQMRPYVGFDLFEQRMRDSLTGLIAAVPRTTKLAYFNTQSVCDAKLAPPALRERALA